MRWTLMALQTSALEADGEVVWSWRPDAGAKFLREAISAKVTGAKEPGPRLSNAHIFVAERTGG
jgi:hypothetical protein